ncbi:hypothetical protein [Streptomyces lydicus]|uniref:hypothetical protein n=1 Tax=Streptomyces lydicus TaxID=47763 RepID=UPI001012E85E|nr:hypothetical protein [Streptomyces lydicus]MCZ1006394.1 hypothetical protein [Streptomyces lydicus]
MNTEIHLLRYRELLREADHYRLALMARKTEPPPSRPGRTPPIPRAKPRARPSRRRRSAA